jgi:amino acid transporter
MGEYINVVLTSLPVIAAPFLILYASSNHPDPKRHFDPKTAGVGFLAIVLGYVVLVMDMMFGAKHMPLWENVLFLVVVFFGVLITWSKFGPGC